MDKNELIEFGNNLKQKGRSPREIVAALRNKTLDESLIDKVTDVVFEIKKVKYKPDELKELLKANRTKLSFEYSIKGLIRLSFIVIALGVITFLLSSEKVNQNALHGLLTLFQGLALYFFYFTMNKKKRYHFLRNAAVLYFFVWFFEFFFFGYPNNLLKAYEQVDIQNNINLDPMMNLNSKFGIKVGAALFIGALYPIIYLTMKLLFGFISFKAYWSFKKYNELSSDIKERLKIF